MARHSSSSKGKVFQWHNSYILLVHMAIIAGKRSCYIATSRPSLSDSLGSIDTLCKRHNTCFTN